MRNKYKIGIWGQFGDGGKLADGQAVRTTIITEELENNYGKENLLILNTNNWKKHPLLFLYQTIKLNVLCEKVIIFPADNGFKIVVSIFDKTNILFRRKLFDVVIGGYLPALLKKKPRYKKYLNKYDALFVQTDNLKKDLLDIGLTKIFTLSNLKRLNTVEEKNIILNKNKELKLCTLSRVNMEKGIDYAVEAVEKANDELGGDFLHLDIYGIIAEDYRTHFNDLLKHYRNISYGGVLDYSKTVEVLKDYSIMLFPTFYYGEGFPGNVVDAYNSGLPIIATDWLYNSDVIQDGKNGILVSIKDSNELKDAILRFYRDREMLYRISCNNVREAAKYTPEVVLREFYEVLER